jgi:hypothetical protein
MESLRKPFFVAAIILSFLAVLGEVSGKFLLVAKPGETNSKSKIDTVDGLANSLTQNHLPVSLPAANSGHPPAGDAIPAMALLDFIVLFTVGLMGSQFLLGENLQGRIQGLVSLIVSLIILIVAVLTFLAIMAKLLLMVGLFLAIPFGTLVYLAVWGSFDTGGDQVALGLLLGLKVGFAICLVLAHQGFLKQKGLMLLVLTSFLANFLISFLHALVPSILVSITDDIACLIVIVLAVIWAIQLFIFSVISVVKAITGVVV